MGQRRFLKEVREEHQHFLRAAYEEANGAPGVLVHRDDVMRALGISERSEYEGSLEFHVWVGTVDNVAEDFTTFSLTPKGVEAVEHERSSGLS
jgi:hypothetical protein